MVNVLYLGVRVSDRKKSGVAPTTFFPITFCSMLVPYNTYLVGRHSSEGKCVDTLKRRRRIVLHYRTLEYLPNALGRHCIVLNQSHCTSTRNEYPSTFSPSE